jgi:hypothetical protein
LKFEGILEGSPYVAPLSRPELLAQDAQKSFNSKETAFQDDGMAVWQKAHA